MGKVARPNHFNKNRRMIERKSEPMRTSHQFRFALRLAVLFATISLPIQLAGQRYNFKFYGEEEGLENLVVQVVLQDRAGFLWVGTQNGLFRYDGSRFRAFGRADGLPAG